MLINLAYSDPIFTDTLSFAFGLEALLKFGSHVDALADEQRLVASIERGRPA